MVTTYFNINELIHSDTATRCGIDNTPPPDIRVKLANLINQCLDPIRKEWGKPIFVNSGYRCPVLNNKVGGKSTSQHLKGYAADINAGSTNANKRLFALIKQLVKDNKLTVDQCIDESDYRWIHVSYVNDVQNRNQFLHL